MINSLLQIPILGLQLSRPNETNQNEQRQQQQQQQTSKLFSLEGLKGWPNRFRQGFNAKMDEAKAKSETKTEFVFEVLHAFSGVVIWILCFICTIIVPVILFFIGLANLDNCPDRPREFHHSFFFSLISLWIINQPNRQLSFLHLALPYLIFATGFVMTSSNLFNLALALDLPILTNHQILTSEIKNTIASIINIIFNCVVAFLYIISAYMVFTIGKKSKRRDLLVDNATNNSGSSEESSPDDNNIESSDVMECSGLLYYTTFWFITLTLGLFVVLSLIATVFFAYNQYRLAIVRGSMPRSQSNTNTTPTNRVWTV